MSDLHPTFSVQLAKMLLRDQTRKKVDVLVFAHSGVRINSTCRAIYEAFDSAARQS